MINVEDTHSDHQPSSPMIYYKKAKLTWSKDYKAYHLSSKLKALPFYLRVAEMPFLLVFHSCDLTQGNSDSGQGVGVTHE